MDFRTRLSIAGAFISGLSAFTRLLFVATKLPVIFWPDLFSGIVAVVVSAFLFILLRQRLRRVA